MTRAHSNSNAAESRSCVTARRSVLSAGTLPLALLFLATAVLAWPVPAEAQDSPFDAFKRIEPILQQHCVECHGPAKQSANLRLDQREHAVKGGSSQQPVVGGSIETNELLKRVKSSDPEYRMPRHRPALSAAEIESIEAWVKEGSPWPSAKAGRDESASSHRLERLAAQLFSPHGYVLIGGLGAWWVLWRCRRDARKADAGAVRQAPSWVRALAKISWAWLLAIVLACWLALTWSETRQLKSLVAKLEARPDPNNITWERVLGSPPRVIHPGHPPRLKSVYYRGNCERNPKLFNNGNYRTSTLHVALCDLTGKEINWGDPLPAALAVRFEIQRAPGATRQLFSDEIMSGVFLSSQHFDQMPKRREKPIRVLSPVVPGERWAAIYPITTGPINAQGELLGRVYVHAKGMGVAGDEHELAAQCHYGIEYQIKIADGRIGEGSQLWANAIYLTGVVQWPAGPGNVPFNQWFDKDPIPEITGTNSTDPKLLGIPDHVKEK